MKQGCQVKKAVIKLYLDNLEVLAMHPSQYVETEVRDENWSGPRSNPIQILSKAIEPRSEEEFTGSDR